MILSRDSINMKRKQSSASNGFTLVELLATIAVLAILAAGLLAIVNPVAQTQKAKDAQRKSDLEQISRSLEQYYNDNNTYPASITFGSAWGSYMAKVPQDPMAGRTYVYKTVSNNQIYYLYASLERGSSDSQVCTGGNYCPNAPTAANACGGYCNYGIASSNATP